MQRNFSKIISSGILVLIASAGFFAHQAFATAIVSNGDDGSISQELSLSPFIFNEQIQKGQSAREVIVLTNQSSDTIQLSAATSDFIPGADNGNPIFNPDDAQNNPQYSLSSWLSIGKVPPRVAPGSAVTIPVTITVPTDAEDGSHYGGVLFTYSIPQPFGLVSITKKAATLFFVQTGTANPQLSIQKFQANKKIVTGGTVSFSSEFLNDGNIHLQPKGYIHISNLFGTEVAAVQVNADAHILLPQTSRTFISSWNTSFRFGPYQLDQVVYYGAPGQTVFEAHAIQTIWILPVMPLVIILVALIILFFLARFGIRKYKKHILERAGIHQDDDPKKN